MIICPNCNAGVTANERLIMKPCKGTHNKFQVFHTDITTNVCQPKIYTRLSFDNKE